MNKCNIAGVCCAWTMSVIILKKSSFFPFCIAFVWNQNNHEEKLHIIIINENWKYLGNNFDWSLPKTCLGKLLNMTSPPTNEIHIEQPNQEANENMWDKTANFEYKVGFSFRSIFIRLPEYFSDTPTQTAIVRIKALNLISCLFGKKNPPGNWTCWSFLVSPILFQACKRLMSTKSVLSIDITQQFTIIYNVLY